MTGKMASTFFYDRIEGEWINGPSLILARQYQAAGIVTDEVTGEHFVAVTGGYHYGDFLDTTEILQDGEWVQGKITNTICHLLKTCWLHNSFFTQYCLTALLYIYLCFKYSLKQVARTIILTTLKNMYKGILV